MASRWRSGTDERLPHTGFQTEFSARRFTALKRPPAKPANPAPYKIEVLGVEKTRARDLYHQFLQTSWPRAVGLILLIVAAYLGVRR